MGGPMKETLSTVLKALRGRAVGRIVLAVAVVFAACGGWSYWRASQDEAINFGAERDRVLEAGKQAVAVLNTIDSAQAERDLRAWLEASTGSLRTELERARPQHLQRVQQMKTSTRGTVTDAAVTQLDTRAGTARMIAMVRIEVTPASGGGATIERKRFEAGLSRTSEGWKLQSLTAIPVNTS